jgi:predicted DNA-binding transcriptional regulator AlpA
LSSHNPFRGLEQLAIGYDVYRVSQDKIGLALQTKPRYIEAIDGQGRPARSQGREPAGWPRPNRASLSKGAPTMNTTATKPAFVTDAGLADLLHVSVRTLQRWVKEPDFPAPLQLGRCRRWDRDDVLTYLRSRTTGKRADHGAVAAGV